MAYDAASRPRLILLTQFYDPEPAYKGQGFAEAVRDLGYDVEVVTGFPNYPGGQVYDGYRIRPWQRITNNGVRITRLALYPSHSRHKTGRIVNYLSFFFSAFLYLVFTARRAELIYVYNPPLTVGLAAAASRIIHRCPVIVDIHDLWPDTLPATGMISNPRLLRWIDRAAGWMYRKVQFIILHTEGFREKLLERGVPSEKMQSVIGWTNELPVPEESYEAVKKLTAMPGLKVLYAGNIGPAQALDVVLDAATLLEKEGLSEEVSFCFMGDGVSRESLENRAVNLGLRNVLFLPRVTLHEVGAFLNAADVLLVHLCADPLFEITLPSKTQAYMFAGKPILMAVNGEAARLVKRAGSGVIATPEEAQSLFHAVMTLSKMTATERTQMGQRGRDYYLSEFSMAKGMKTFAEIFAQVRKKKLQN